MLECEWLVFRVILPRKENNRVTEIKVPDSATVAAAKKLSEERINLIRKVFERKGKILVSNGEFRGYTTFVEFEAFARSGPRNRRRAATDLLRKAVAEYPGENDSDKYRKPSTAYLAFSDTINGMWIEYNLPEKLRYEPENPRTVEERLRKHWLTAEKHPQGLFGIEIEFATEKKQETKVVQFGRGVCENGPECCPPIGPTVMKEITRDLPPTVYRDIEAIVPGTRIKTDGSVVPKHSDAQEANLLAGPNGFARLKKLCQLIKDRGGIINKTCGLHVHLDAREDEKRIVGIRADKLWDFMPIMKDLVPDDRLNNKYCIIEKPAFDGNRYRAINLDSWRTHKTLEVRFASGSLHPAKIWFWAHLLLYVSKANERYPDWETFLQSKFNFHMKLWAVRRANELRPNAKLMKERINLIVPGLNDILKEEYDSEEIDVSKLLKGQNV